MSERTSFQITLPWATQEDVDDFFTPPTKPVKPLFVAAYLLAQLFFFIALLGPAIVAIQVKVMAMFPSDNSAIHIKKRSKLNGMKMPFCAVSTRTYSYKCNN